MSSLFEVELTGYAFGGNTIGRLADGKTVFVPYGIVGEKVQIELVEEKRNFSRGQIVNVITPSPIRVQPRCRHFQTCGGCHYQHLAYCDQLKIKQQVFDDQFKRVFKTAESPIQPIVPSPDEWNYRNTVQFHISPNGKPGYQFNRSSEGFELSECHLPQDPVNQIWPLLDLEADSGVRRVSIRCGSDDELMIRLESDDPQPPDFEVDFPVSVVFSGSDTNILLSGEEYSLITIDEHVFKVSAASFFQVNTKQAAAMVRKVLNLIQLPKNATLIDAYCGVGLFSAFLAPKVKNLIGIELSESSCNDYADNLNEYENTSLYIGSVEQILPSLKIHPDVILLDPPRSGLDPKALAGVTAANPSQIIYVSCDPPTLFRDLKNLVSAGYVIESITPFDLFPQTYHIEAIVSMSKVK